MSRDVFSPLLDKKYQDLLDDRLIVKVYEPRIHTIVKPGTDNKQEMKISVGRVTFTREERIRSFWSVVPLVDKREELKVDALLGDYREAYRKADYKETHPGSDYKKADITCEQIIFGKKEKDEEKEVPNLTLCFYTIRNLPDFSTLISTNLERACGWLDQDYWCIHVGRRGDSCPYIASEAILSRSSLIDPVKITSKANEATSIGHLKKDASFDDLIEKLKEFYLTEGRAYPKLRTEKAFKVPNETEVEDRSFCLAM